MQHVHMTADSIGFPSGGTETHAAHLSLGDSLKRTHMKWYNLHTPCNHYIFTIPLTHVCSCHILPEGCRPRRCTGQHAHTCLVRVAGQSHHASTTWRNHSIRRHYLAVLQRRVTPKLRLRDLATMRLPCAAAPDSVYKGITHVLCNLNLSAITRDQL